jgi:exonuclease SbcD
MRIVHLADTHLGYSAYRRATDDGINQREVDVYDAFTQCIDYALKIKPDLVLHAGDLFDSVRPTNRAITVAVQQLLRLSKEDIPFVVISGNHETPKLRETGNIFTIFEHLKNAYPIHNNRYETVSLPIGDRTAMIHAIPQCQSPKEFDKNFKRIIIKEDVNFNILVAHGAVAGIKEFKMNEFNELFIPVKAIKQDFDYIGLGHYHMYTRLQENAFYAGSTEHLSFTEADAQKGFLDLQLGAHLKQSFIPLQTRIMVDVPPLDCSSLTVGQILAKVKETIRTIEPKDKIIRIRLENVPPPVQRGIDFQEVKQQCKTAVHFEIKSTSLKNSKDALPEGYRMKSLADEFIKFLDTQAYPEKETMLNLGLQYISKNEERDDAT